MSALTLASALTAASVHEQMRTISRLLELSELLRRQRGQSASPRDAGTFRDLVADIGEELCVVYKIMLGVTGGLHEDSLFAGMGHRVLREIVRTVEGLVPVAGVLAGRLHDESSTVFSVTYGRVYGSEQGHVVFD